MIAAFRIDIISPRGLNRDGDMAKDMDGKVKGSITEKWVALRFLPLIGHHLLSRWAALGDISLIVSEGEDGFAAARLAHSAVRNAVIDERHERGGIARRIINLISCRLHGL